MRAERVKLKSCKDEKTIAQQATRRAGALRRRGNERRPGLGTQNVILPLFTIRRARWRLPLAGLQTPSADPETLTPDWESPFGPCPPPGPETRQREIRATQLATWTRPS